MTACAGSASSEATACCQLAAAVPRGSLGSGALIIRQFAQHPRGVADRNGPLGDASRHHRTGTDNRTLADRDTRQDRNVEPEPGAVANLHGVDLDPGPLLGA